MLQIIGLLILIGLIVVTLKNISKILSFLTGLSIIGGFIWLIYQYPIQTIASIASITIATAITSRINDASTIKKIKTLIENQDKKGITKYYASKSKNTKQKIINYIIENTNLRTKGEILSTLYSADFINYMSKRSNSSKTSIVERTDIENHLNPIWNQDGLEQYSVSNISKILKKAKHAHSVTFETPNSTEKGKSLELVRLTTEPENNFFENAINLDED